MLRDVLDLSEDEIGAAREQAEKIELPVIRNALGQIASLSVPSGSPPLPLEIAFAGISLSAETVQRGADEGKQDVQEERRVEETRVTEPPPARQRQRQAEPQQRAPQRNQESARPSPARTEPEFPRAGSRPSPMVAQRQRGAEPFEMPPGELTLETLKNRWRELIRQLKGVGSSGRLDAFLRGVTHPLDIEDGDTIVIGFTQDFQKEKIDDPKYRRLIEQRFSEVLRKPYKIRSEKIDQVAAGGHLIRAAQEIGGRVVSGRDQDEGEEN